MTFSCGVLEDHLLASLKLIEIASVLLKWLKYYYYYF